MKNALLSVAVASLAISGLLFLVSGTAHANECPKVSDCGKYYDGPNGLPFEWYPCTGSDADSAYNEKSTRKELLSGRCGQAADGSNCLTALGAECPE